MDIFTKAKISPRGQLNELDLRKIANSALIFFAAPILMYLGQLQAILTQEAMVSTGDFIPNFTTIGAIEGWAVGICINFFLKLRDGKK